MTCCSRKEAMRVGERGEGGEEEEEEGEGGLVFTGLI